MTLDPATLRLVAITDHVEDGIDALTARAAAAVRGGATMLQVRLKTADARALFNVARRLVETLPVPVIVNDRVDVAIAAGAAGVHVGASDLPVRAVRAISPPNFVVGASLGSADEADNARNADYAGIGPVYSTQTKGDAGAAIGAGGLASLRALVAIPCVGIGGITPDNVRPVMSAGVEGVAVIAGIFGSRDPESAARALRAEMGR